MVFFSYPPLKIQISTQIYIYRSRSPSRTSENNFRGLFLSKLHYTCGHLVLVLVSVTKSRKILSGFSNTSVPNITQYHHHQSNYKSTKKPQGKKKHSALTEWYKCIFWNSHLWPRRKKNSVLIKQYWDVFHLLPSKSCVDLSSIFLLLKDYFQLLLYLSSHFSDLKLLFLSLLYITDMLLNKLSLFNNSYFKPSMISNKK